VASIGRDLLDLPFAEVVRNLALAIAEGQAALDRNSLDTLKELVNEDVDVLTDVTEVIEPFPIDVVANQAAPPMRISGARVRASGLPPISMSLFQAGLRPTFYQFTEATVEARLSITMREDRESQERGRRFPSGRPFLALGFSRAYAAPVDFRSANTYSYQAQGASILRTTMRPVPPPARLEPTVTTVNTLAQPPVVTRAPL
jgi:hypothetical protein